MPSKPVEPQLGADSFSCPHCGAFAHQSFQRGFANDYDKGKRPSVLRYHDGMRERTEALSDENGNKKKLRAFVQRLEKHALTYMHTGEYGETCYWEMVNLAFSMCYSCGGFAIWVEDKLIYPVRNTTIIAHEGMPAPIREDFDEAASIVDKSPRGAAALLRLCIQKLMPILKEKGKDLNEDMDIVRVTGNHAVHPGQIDLEDDKAIAIKLFELVNLIVESRISRP